MRQPFSIQSNTSIRTTFANARYNDEKNIPDYKAMNQEKEEKGSYICEYKKQVLYLLSKLTAML